MTGRCSRPADPCSKTFGSPVVHLGPLGSGQTAKLINNFVFTAQLSTAIDTFEFADRMGIDPGALGVVLAHGSGGSRAAAILSASGIDLTGLHGAAPLLRKDVDLVLDVAGRHGLDAPDQLLAAALRSLDMLEHPTESAGP